MIAENIGIFYLSTVITEFLFFKKILKSTGNKREFHGIMSNQKFMCPSGFFNE